MKERRIRKQVAFCKANDRRQGRAGDGRLMPCGSVGRPYHEGSRSIFAGSSEESHGHNRYELQGDSGQGGDF